ncbi:MAG TPA: tetraacyldisaccharide 4'-kinase, partial [Tepidisphaeraceae bacterium]|nr:tetraacyldisaccharide 4'-kinase [Tepidisphaeraceae bacterium]
MTTAHARVCEREGILRAMSPQRIRAIQSGAARDLVARLLRAGTCGISAAYARAAVARNRRFDVDASKSTRVDRKVISVGNLTAGGTGKTPVVAWLAKRLFALDERPAILTRGYKSKDGKSDEATLLESELSQLEPNSSISPVPIGVDPDRISKARSLLETHPDISVFILDDGFQHRKLARDFDLVLIDATNPFGFDHVLPRGLLREPVDGLKRAHAVLITRAAQVDSATLE